MKNEKDVVDLCCGSRMFWFDREDDRVLFLDKRAEEFTLKDKSSSGGFRKLSINPDMLCDFRDLPFEDNSFKLVIFDPPHFLRNGESGWIHKKYGSLTENWKEDITKGFKEGFRVLCSGGTLILKWNEDDISLKEILSLTEHKPLIGNKFGKSQKSHFIVFFKS